MNYDRNWIKQDLLDRFVRYVKIHTTSDHHIEEIPSTPGQWDLLNLLKAELLSMGIDDLSLDSHGYLIARIPGRGEKTGPDAGKKAGISPKTKAAASANTKTKAGLKAKPNVRTATKAIGLMAHVDTASDVSGKDVKPQIFTNYQGGDLQIGKNCILKSSENPMLKESMGDTIITSDGSTLLGADDKAGVAEIMTALKWLVEHPDIDHCPFEVIFTPDEETGKGMNRFPLELLNAECCYTFDGGERGTIEGECFNASAARVSFTGNVVHLGIARGKLVNAVTMASRFIDMLPQNESPESTDGRYGYYAPFEISGDLEAAEVSVYLRDFETEGMSRRMDTLRRLAKAIEGIFPGGKVSVESKELYSNMREHIEKNPLIIEVLEEAIKKTGIEPVRRIIRGGTDGARLSEMGVPTPNVFTGGYNFHSRLEWASLNTMAEAAETAINLVRLWAEKAEA